ncbi:MAG: PKD domain-containing protein [Chloroflexi bacterium]|nr:PKD domain-containing protein [Chloroflexota bacterium]
MKAIRVLAIVAVLVGALALPAAAGAAPGAQGGLTVKGLATATCAEAQFIVSVEGAAAPYELTIDFGDGERLTIPGEGMLPAIVAHAYAAGGAYAWQVTATSGDLSGAAGGTLVIGPSVSLTSDPFPPLLPLVDGQASVALTAEVAGGTAPFAYTWTLDGASTSMTDPASPTASATYTAGGTYSASVVVTDGCGLSASDTLAIVVDDPLAEGCHPVAEWIAEAVSSLYPQQAEQLYTCEDIYDYFTGGLTGSQLGFGIMRHAYTLATTIPDLTWEQILDWKLEGSGWGQLVQLDRIAQALGEVGLVELIERVATGENSLGDIRSAARVALRYEADFAAALDLLAGGASNGELGQIYRTAGELGIDPAVVAGYQEMGVRAVELQQAARVAERLGADWASVLEAHAAGESWGSIRRGEAEEAPGPGNSQGQGNGQGQDNGQEPKKNEIQNEVNLRLAEQLAARYGLTIEAVQAMYGTCGGDWGCVRTTLRLQVEQHGRGKPK